MFGQFYNVSSVPALGVALSWLFRGCGPGVNATISGQITETDCAVSINGHDDLWDKSGEWREASKTFLPVLNFLQV